MTWDTPLTSKSTPHNGNFVAEEGDALSIHWALRDLQTQENSPGNESLKVRRVSSILSKPCRYKTRPHS